MFPKIINVRRVSGKSREVVTVRAYGPEFTYIYDVNPVPNGVLSINGDTLNPLKFTSENMTTVFTPDRNTCGRDITYTMTMESRDTLNYKFLNPLPLGIENLLADHLSGSPSSAIVD